MTLLAGAGSRLGALVAQRAVQVAAAGLLSGAVAGGAVVAAGLSPFDRKQTSATLAVLACPGSGPELAHIPGGQTMLVTARSVDGQWLEVYVGEPGVERGWAQASALRLQGAPDGLPVGSCVAIASVPSSAPTPNPSPSPSPEPGPSILPTVGPSPTPTPVPTPPPDLTPPSITGVSIADAYTTGDGNYYIYISGSGCGFPYATISIAITDAGGSGLDATTVRLHWIDPNNGSHQVQMGYNLTSHRYVGKIDAGNWVDGNIQYWVTASDHAGNAATTSSPPDNSHWLFKSSCIP